MNSPKGFHVDQRLFSPGRSLFVLSALTSLAAPSLGQSITYDLATESPAALAGQTHKILHGDVTGDGAQDVISLAANPAPGIQLQVIEGLPTYARQIDLAGDYDDVAVWPSGQTDSSWGSYHDALITVRNGKVMAWSTGTNAGDSTLLTVAQTQGQIEITGPWTNASAVFADRLESESFTRLAVVDQDGRTVHTSTLPDGALVSGGQSSMSGTFTGSMMASDQIINAQFLDHNGDGTRNEIAIHHDSGVDIRKFQLGTAPIQEIVQAGFTVNAIQRIEEDPQGGELLAAVILMSFDPDQYVMVIGENAYDPPTDIPGVNDITGLIGIDPDGDGKIDLGLLRPGDYLEVLPSKPTGNPNSNRFEGALIATYGLDSQLSGMTFVEKAVLDLDYDGDPDLVLLSDTGTESHTAQYISGSTMMGGYPMSAVQVAGYTEISSPPASGVVDALNAFELGLDFYLPSTAPTDATHVITRVVRHDLPDTFPTGEGPEDYPIDTTWGVGPLVDTASPGTTYNYDISFDVILDPGTGEPYPNMTTVFYSETTVARITSGLPRRSYSVQTQAFFAVPVGGIPGIEDPLDALGGPGDDAFVITEAVAAKDSKEIGVVTVPVPYIPPEF